MTSFSFAPPIGESYKFDAMIKYVNISKSNTWTSTWISRSDSIFNFYQLPPNGVSKIPTANSAHINKNRIKINAIMRIL